MGFATILATMAMIFVFASMIVFGATVQKGLTHASVQQSDRQQLSLAAGKEQLSITATAYSYGATVPWRTDLYSDFAAGTTSGTTVQGAGSVTLSGPAYANGTYESEAFDSGVAGTNYSTISWTSIEPADTNVGFQLRSAASAAALSGATYTGPDGTANTYYTASGAGLHASLSGNRYAQFQAYLWTNNSGSTPEVQLVSIEVTRPAGHIFVNVTNAGSSLDPAATDVYVGGVRVSRNDSERTLVLNDVAEQSLWNGDETIEIVVYQSLVAGAPLVVANSHGRDETVVSP